MEQPVKAFLNQLADPAVILDESGGINFSTSEFEDLVGKDITISTRNNISDSPRLFQDSDLSVEQILESGREKSCSSVAITSSDGSTEFELSLYPLDDETQGEYLGIVQKDAKPLSNQDIEMWASLMEKLPDITPLVDISCLLTPDHKFISVNEGATEPYGMSPEDFHGEFCYELVHDQDEPINACPCEEVLIERDAISGNEFQENGRHYVAAAAPIFADNGEIGAIAHTVQDITERKHREETLDQYRQAIEASDDLIAAIDEDERYMFANSTYREYYGVEDVVGKPVNEVVDKDTYETDVHPLNQEVFNGKTVTYERTETFPEKGERTLAITYTPIRIDSSITGLIAVFRDITERKEREEELRRQKDRLDDFASVVSHDLRNPLNVAQGRIELAQEGCDSEHLGHAAKSVDRSLEMIDDLLTLARKGQPVSELLEVDLDVIVEGAWQTVNTTDATLDLRETPTIQADPARLRQLFENLIRNAVEHGGKDVTVTVGELNKGFFVGDDGKGIEPNRREKVFEGGHTTAEAGTGLGLQIVEEIAEAHDWDIKISEGTHGGARFEITDVEVVA